MFTDYKNKMLTGYKNKAIKDSENKKENGENVSEYTLVIHVTVQVEDQVGPGAIGLAVSPAVDGKQEISPECGHVRNKNDQGQ